MEWYWIILIVAIWVYSIIGSFVIGLMIDVDSNKPKRDIFVSFAMGFLWPIVLLIGFIAQEVINDEESNQ